MEEELFSEWFGSFASAQRDDVPIWGQFCAKNSSAKFPHFCGKSQSLDLVGKGKECQIRE